MTDKEKILAFLEGMSKGCCPKETKEIIINIIIPWINDLPKEPVNEDFKIALEKKVREAQDWTYIEEEGCECPLSEEFGAYDLEEFARWGANWQKEQDQSTIELAEDHAMLAGMEKMKEEMMKEAVDGTVFTQLEDGEIMVRSHYFKSEKFNYLDEVKLIIIKEE